MTTSTAFRTCPLCEAGCGLEVTITDGAATRIRGDRADVFSRGFICPKGSALFGLTVNDQRWTTVKYRAPYSDKYEERPLGWALERIAQLVKKTRDENWIAERDGKRVNGTLAIASLGGATFGVEENYMLQKLMHTLGVLSIENQARI